MRRSVVRCAERLEEQGRSQAGAAARIGVKRTTVRSWRETLAGDPGPRPRGRRPSRSSLETRTEILSVLEEEGTGVGIPELKRRFPDASRHELEELRSRWAWVVRARGAEATGLHVLHWTVPGTVWATDFTDTPVPVDGFATKLLLVRDLASGMQLLSMPCEAECAAEVLIALSALFAEHGAPLVLKLDNGPGFIAEEVRALCERHGVLLLYSPPYTPSYNGSCEAGNGSVKRRGTRIAAAHDRSACWSSDDVEAARLQANACSRPRGPNGPSPDELWSERHAIESVERLHLSLAFHLHELALREQLEIESTYSLPRDLQAMIDRRALPKALIERDYLNIRRR